VARRVAAHRTAPEQGASVVEFAFVAIPLLLLLMGILYFGMLLSFKQAVTQSAAEGARAAAGYSATTQSSAAITAATNAANRPLGSWSKTCSSAGFSCQFGPPTACSNDATKYCMTVTISYNYSSNPLLPAIPLLSSALPSTIKSTAVVQMNS
jgi:Flp pilus assembly protein TadG